MIRALMVIPLTAVLVSAVVAGAEQASFERDYGVVVQRSIFKRERRSAALAPQRVEAAEAPEPVPPEAPQAGFVLVGLVIEGDEARAHVEQATPPALLTLRAGDEVAGGRVAGVTLDAMTFEHDGESVRVLPGMNLLGRPAQPAAALPTAQPTTTGNPGGAATPPASGDNLSVAERMRLRRQQELGQ